jgi:Xaa-Pro aminopeptidase
LRFCITLIAIVAALTLEAPAQRPGKSAAEYQSRRAALAKALGGDAVFIAFSREPAPRRRRRLAVPPGGHLLHLTGMNGPETTLVLIPGERERGELIFARDRDPSKEAWTGRTLRRTR